MKITSHAITLLAASALMLSVLVACTNRNETASTDGITRVTIMHYKTGANVGALFFLPQVDRFNAKYAGKYQLTIEEVPNDMYVELIKQLGLQNRLPVLIEGGDQTWLEEVIIPGNRFVDLSSWLDSKPELKARFPPEALQHNTRNGRLFSLGQPVIRPMTVFYNRALYTPSRPFAEMSWEAVAAELGDNKIAFMTGENAWTTMLVWSSLVASEAGGPQLLTDGVSNKIMNYNHPAIINATRRLQNLLRNHAAANTVGAAYADAANAFMSRRAALIANGSWMVSDFTPDKSGNWSNGFDGNDVHGDVLPGNIGLANIIGYGWWIPSSATPAQQELAKAFIEFMNSPEELEAFMLAEGGTAPRVTLSPTFLARRAENRLMDEYVGAVKATTLIVPAIGDAMPASIANHEFPRILPLLINGQLSPEDFCAELTRRAAESAL